MPKFSSRHSAVTSWPILHRYAYPSTIHRDEFQASSFQCFLHFVARTCVHTTSLILVACDCSCRNIRQNGQLSNADLKRSARHSQL